MEHIEFIRGGTLENIKIRYDIFAEYWEIINVQLTISDSDTEKYILTVLYKLPQ